MADIFVLAEHRQGALRDVTWELLGLARRLVDQTGSGQVVAVILGHGVSGFCSELSRAAHRVLWVEDPLLANFNANIYQEVLSSLIRDHKPVLTLIGHTGFGVDLAPALSVQTDLPLVTDSIDLGFMSGRLVATRQLYAGKIWAKVSWKDRGIATIRPGSAAPAASDLSGQIVTVASPLTGSFDFRKFLEYVEAAVGDVDITQAAIVVAAGRGVKEEDNMSMVHELAKTLGGVVAGSRPVVDAGWLTKDRQVGSSGKTVKPKLYLALGISGSFQHVVGMKGAETIVAINKDPNAPIFSQATFGIVGDLLKVVPVLTSKLKELRG